MKSISTEQELIDAVNEYGILPFWSEEYFCAYSMSAVNFNAFWTLRERAVNSRKIAYGKFVNKKAAFVSLALLPHLCALRRDGYDFDSLSDEGKAPRREITVMENIKPDGTRSYELGKSLDMRGYDGVVTSLQNKTYLCLQFAKSAMGSALLCTPESLFGSDFVRSEYNTDMRKLRDFLIKRSLGLRDFTADFLNKTFSPCV